MHSQSVNIPADAVTLIGDLVVPKRSCGLVLFAHGSGSGRRSPRNMFVAEQLQRKRLATLLFDLLTETEDRQYRNRFDIALLAERLLAATRWAATEPSVKGLATGYFGASTGAAAALYAAAAMPSTKAIVSRGGRPDLAMSALPHVGAATLLIVGGADETVLALNKLAYAQLKGPRALEVIPEATHLFEEPGALEEVARLAADWFRRYLSPEKS
jgi:putative phosphoribosyl transferase